MYRLRYFRRFGMWDLYDTSTGLQMATTEHLADVHTWAAQGKIGTVSPLAAKTLEAQDPELLASITTQPLSA